MFFVDDVSIGYKTEAIQMPTTPLMLNGKNIFIDNNNKTFELYAFPLFGGDGDQLEYSDKLSIKVFVGDWIS